MTSEDQKILFEKLGKQMNYTLGLPNFKLINDVIYKLCTKCKKYKPMTSKFFPRRNNVKCGYGSHCKECEKEKESKRIRIPSFNENGELYCHVCKTYKDVSEFYKGEKNGKFNHTADFIRCICLQRAEKYDSRRADRVILGQHSGRFPADHDDAEKKRRAASGRKGF